MGGAESRESSEFINNFQHKYTFFREVHDKRFGDILVYKHNTDEKFIAKRGHLCNTSEEYTKYISECKQRQRFNHENFLQLYHTYEANEEQLCGDFNKVTIFFEYYFHDLEKELTRRKESQEYFTEPELWYLIDSLISVNCFLEKNKIYHGDLRSPNILLTPEGHLKIGDHGLLHTDQSGYAKMLTGREKCYLSPSLLKALAHNEIKPVHDNWKSDVYSLGMTLLEAATLVAPFACYDFNNCTISNTNIEKFLESVGSRYSEMLVNVLRKMLTEIEVNRPTFKELSELIAPTENTVTQTVTPVIEIPPEQPLIESMYNRTYHIPAPPAPAPGTLTKPQPVYYTINSTNGQTKLYNNLPQNVLRNSYEYPNTYLPSSSFSPAPYVPPGQNVPVLSQTQRRF